MKVKLGFFCMPCFKMDRIRRSGVCLAIALALYLLPFCVWAAPRKTPFPLSEQLVPSGGYIIIYSPRNRAHHPNCGDVTLTFEVVGTDPSLLVNHQVSTLVNVGDANPIPVPLGGAGLQSLTIRLREAGTFTISITLLGPERMPKTDIPPARIRISCGACVSGPATFQGDFFLDHKQSHSRTYTLTRARYRDRLQTCGMRPHSKYTHTST